MFVLFQLCKQLYTGFFLISTGNHLIPLTLQHDCYMATWTAFYVKTTNGQGFKEKLISLTGITTVAEGRFPTDHYASYLLNEAVPDYLAFTSTQPGWITVIYNSSNKLTDWCIDISKQFNGGYCNRGTKRFGYYYFALYDKGVLQREIEYCYSEDYIPTNFGKKFDFEEEEPGEQIEYNGGVTYLFDFDSIEKYCAHFGLTIQCNYQEFDWTILKGKRSAQTVAQTEQALNGLRKPWWKFW